VAVGQADGRSGAAAGLRLQLEKVSAKEKELAADPKELQVRELFRQRSEALSGKLARPAESLAADKLAAAKRMEQLKGGNASVAEISSAAKTLAAMPRDEAAAVKAWTAARAAADVKTQPLNGMPAHAAQFSGDPDGTPKEQEAYDTSRRNFLALVFCLMVGTAALPHILMRYYTVPSVREARQSVTWSLFFIFLLYFTAPALAVLVKYEIFTMVVGMPFDQLPAWVNSWSRVDPSLLSVTDVNRDNILQLNEMTIGGDIIVLLTPELAGCPM
jgi:cation/acetate symporter